MVEYLFVGQYHNQMDNVEEAYLHFFSHTHLNIFFIELIIQKFFELDLCWSCIIANTALFFVAFIDALALTIMGA